jgi:glutathione synthase/RimK-type ligase-like ATP-grasp enzyme
MIECAQSSEWNVVCKPNDGTGGRDVLHVRTPRDLELAALKLFQRYNALAMCPFVEIAHEFRVIILCDEPLLQYEKVRPTVIGDGKRRVVDLVTTLGPDSSNTERLGRILRNLDPEVATRLRRVPLAGEEVALNWRHNLGQGSVPKLVERDDIVPLARDAARVANLSFCSVDIVVTKGGQMQVLEINAGVMMETFIDLMPKGEEIARNVYRRAVIAMFGGGGRG